MQVDRDEQVGESFGPLPAPDMQTDPCSADGTQTDYYTAGTVRRLLAAEREWCAKLCEALADDCDMYKPLDGSRGVALRAAAARIRGA